MWVCLTLTPETREQAQCARSIAYCIDEAGPACLTHVTVSGTPLGVYSTNLSVSNTRAGVSNTQVTVSSTHACVSYPPEQAQCARSIANCVDEAGPACLTPEQLTATADTLVKVISHANTCIL